MLSKYFTNFGKNFKKKGTKTKKDKSSQGYDKKAIIDSFAGIIPAHLSVGDLKPIDQSGFSPEGVDFIVYKKHCEDIAEIMNGYIPYELMRASFFVVDGLKKQDLFEVLNKIAMAKKMNSFSQKDDEADQIVVPAFLIVLDSDYDFLELKNDIVNFYLSKNTEHHCELDILMIVNKGLVVKNWREMRSFIALETNEDTNMWFYILMDEYLNVQLPDTIDFRNYVKKEVVYKEY